MKTEKREKTVILIIIVLLAFFLLFSCLTGSFDLSVKQIADIIGGKLSGSIEQSVFFNLRIPRAVMGLLSGLALGLAGGVYQTIFSNPLASPDLTGVASGASLGAAFSIVLGAGTAFQIMAGSFISGLAALALMLLLVRVSKAEKTGAYILSGVVISSLASAGLMILKTMADPERELAAVEFWTMGSLAAVNSKKVLMCAFFVIVPMIIILLFKKQVMILSLGGEKSYQLGLDPSLWRCMLLILTTLMVSSIISVTGVISFAGLLAPHTAALLLGKRSGNYLFLCALAGGLTVIIADILARSLYKYAELPISIFTILFSLPMLVFLFIKKGKSESYA